MATKKLTKEQKKEINARAAKKRQRDQWQDFKSAVAQKLGLSGGALTMGAVATKTGGDFFERTVWDMRVPKTLPVGILSWGLAMAIPNKTASAAFEGIGDGNMGPSLYMAGRLWTNPPQAGAAQNPGAGAAAGLPADPAQSAAEQIRQAAYAQGANDALNEVEAAQAEVAGYGGGYGMGMPPMTDADAAAAAAMLSNAADGVF